MEIERVVSVHACVLTSFRSWRDAQHAASGCTVSDTPPICRCHVTHSRTPRFMDSVPQHNPMYTYNLMYLYANCYIPQHNPRYPFIHYICWKVKDQTASMIMLFGILYCKNRIDDSTPRHEKFRLPMVRFMSRKTHKIDTHGAALNVKLIRVCGGPVGWYSISNM